MQTVYVLTPPFMAGMERLWILQALAIVYVLNGLKAQVFFHILVPGINAGVT